MTTTIAEILENFNDDNVDDLIGLKKVNEEANIDGRSIDN